MPSDYIPGTDATFDPFAINFKTLIIASPTSYGLVVADGVAIGASVDAWHVAYLAATNPTTRTHATILTKNAQRTNCKAVIRGYAATIRANRAVSDALKAGLGLHVASHTHTPVPPPATKPSLTVVFMDQGVQKVRGHDEGSDRRGKPVGSAGMLLFRVVGEDAVTDPTQAVFVSFVSKPDVTNNFSPVDNGKTVTYFGRWTNNKGELGPWSDPVSKRIAA